jgi:hypothetical protein
MLGAGPRGLAIQSQWGAYAARERLQLRLARARAMHLEAP